MQVKVGDNLGRIEAVLRHSLDAADAVIVCGGLGPTHDDLTREAIAAVMGADLVQDDAVAEVITEMFASRGRYMAANNLRQALVPVGAAIIPQTRGTAPGLICPFEYRDARQGGVRGARRPARDEGDARAGGAARPPRRAPATRRSSSSRTLRTWGESESGLNERLDGVIADLDAAGNPTLAFLASGWEGIKVRLTAKAATAAAGEALLAPVGRADPRHRRRAGLRRRRRHDGVGRPRRAAVAGLDQDLHGLADVIDQTIRQRSPFERS